MHVFTCLLRVLLFDITTSASMKHHGKWNDRAYQHTWLHLQSIPYDTCSRTILLCWCSWHQYGSCEIRQNTPRHLRKRNKLCFLFSTVLDCLGPINRLASHVFFLAPKGWLKNCKPWSIQTFLNMKRVKEKMRRDFLHRQKNLFSDTTGHADFSDVKGETSLSCYLGTCSKPITTVIPFLQNFFRQEKNKFTYWQATTRA